MFLQESNLSRVNVSLARNLASAPRWYTIAADARFDQPEEKTAANKATAYVAAQKDLYVVEEVRGRDADGLEADAVIELRDGHWAAFEIKLMENRFREGAASLKRLKDKIALNPAAENPVPAFMAVLVGAGEYAQNDRETGIYIIPITALGA